MTLPQIVGFGSAALVALIFLLAAFLAWYERRDAARALDRAKLLRRARELRPPDGAEVYDPRGYPPLTRPLTESDRRTIIGK